MSLTENSDQVFPPVGCNITQNFEIWPLHYYICYEASPSRQLLSLFKLCPLCQNGSTMGSHVLHALKANIWNT